MGLGTKDLSVRGNKPGSKRAKVQALAVKHTALFDKENVFKPKFIPRKQVEHKGEMYLKFLPQELAGQLNVYTEFCTVEFNPEDPNRTLWKWVYNPEFETEYELSEAHPANGLQFYFIPVNELVNVSQIHGLQPKYKETLVKEVEQEKQIEAEVLKELPDEAPACLDDVQYSDMTLRDYAAIQLRIPCSNKEWLNKLVVST